MARVLRAPAPISIAANILAAHRRLNFERTIMEIFWTLRNYCASSRLVPAGRRNSARTSFTLKMSVNRPRDSPMRALTAALLTLVFGIAHAQQTYPNIEGELILEDDRVVVQRFVLEPGQWEGIHEHPEYQLVIVLKSTDELTFRFRGAETKFVADDKADPGRDRSVLAAWSRYSGRQPQLRQHGHSPARVDRYLIQKRLGCN